MSSEVRRSLKAARPVGHPGPPDLAAMSKGEIEERRATVEKLRGLTEKAQDGDEEAALDIREILDASPDLAWRFIKGPGKMAESAMIGEITRDEDLASKELLKHQLQSMRIEMAGENPSPLERLLAERVVATWLQVQLFETFYAFGMKSGTLSQVATTDRNASTGRTGAISRPYARWRRSAS